MYAKIKENSLIKYPFTVEDLLSENPYTAYTEQQLSDLPAIYALTENGLNGFKLVEVKYQEFNSGTDFSNTKVSYKEKPELIDGQWLIPHVVAELSQTEIINKVNEDKNAVLAIINSKLAESLSDSKRKEWLDYKNHIENIESQSSYPNSIDWGIRPGETMMRSTPDSK